MKKFFLILIFFILLGLGFYFLRFPKQVLNNSAIVEVKKGMGLKALVEEFQKQNLSSSHKLLYYYFRYRNVGSNLKAGEYQLDAGTTLEQASEKLLKGDILHRRFTIPEGYSLKDIAKLLAEKSLANPQSFLQKTLAADAAAKQGETGSSLEGYLFPDTYEYTQSTTEDSLINLLVKNFKKQAEAKLKEAGKVGLTPYQLLTLASIVEKETGKTEERPLIAGVFFNRLKINMPLATDPSIIYGIPNYDGNIRKADLLRDGPYNTYIRPGLPPTPIANPGLKSIEAVLNPTASEYLYFVSKGDGTHQFSKTLQEHEAAVQLYQIQKSGPKKSIE
ncbi:MAG: endolytic transglycosylase MltG [Deltaproteobacteria bacterium]|nr:endolytic transglycosylase MltG [Deltaproteobacteria bacterium]